MAHGKEQYKVWCPAESEEKDAEAVLDWSAEWAAERAAEVLDDNSGGEMFEGDRGRMQTVELHVRCPDGKLEKFTVTADYSKTYIAHEKEEETSDGDRVGDAVSGTGEAGGDVVERP